MTEITTIVPNTLPTDGPAYPRSLRQRLGKGTPPLTIKGPSEWLNGTDHPVIALFSSVKAPARKILQAHELAQQWRTQPVTIISGFQSPLEEEVWTVLLQDMVNPFTLLPEQNGPRLVKVLARSMMQRIAAQERHCITTKSMAFVSPFPETFKRTTKETAQVRNRVAAALADSVLIAHAEEGSSTAHLAQVIQGWDIRLISL